MAEVFSADLYLKRLVTTQFITENGLYYVISFILGLFQKQGFAVFRVKYVTGEDIINNGGC